MSASRGNAATLSTTPASTSQRTRQRGHPERRFCDPLAAEHVVSDAVKIPRQTRARGAHPSAMPSSTIPSTRRSTTRSSLTTGPAPACRYFGGHRVTRMRSPQEAGSTRATLNDCQLIAGTAWLPPRRVCSSNSLGNTSGPAAVGGVSSDRTRGPVVEPPRECAVTDGLRHDRDDKTHVRTQREANRTQTRYLRKRERPAIPVFPRDRGPKLVPERAQSTATSARGAT